MDLPTPDDPRLVYLDKLLYDQYKFLSERATVILDNYKCLKKEEEDLCLLLSEPCSEQQFICVPSEAQMCNLRESIDNLIKEKVLV